jgi:Holliday junction resolvase-like predicted endonuclease
MSNKGQRFVGKLSENIASRYVSSLGHSVLTRNYRKRVGEIDIVSRITGNRKCYFWEVKGVSCESIDHCGAIRPEDNFHDRKASKFLKIVKTYAALNGIADSECVLGLIVVMVDVRAMRFKLRVFNDLVLFF